MADVNANIGVNIDTSAALAQLKALQRQISQFHSSIARSSESAAIAQKSLQKNLIGSINSIGAFSAELRTVRTSAESFTNSLEKNKFSMREYFRYAGASTKTFGRLFKSEFDTIGKVAEERVKTLQTQYIKMGRNASGAMEAIAIRPTSLNMQDYGTRTAIAAQKQALFNQLMKQGTTNLLNFGKNTQWAGRQLMVGFTIPLTIVGSTATRTFMEMEAQTIKFKKVYGDLFTPKEETKLALDNITELGKQFTKYGIAVSQTVGLAAEAAAAGFQGLDLQRQTTEATRLSVLGQIDSQKALETTISLQNAFGMSSDKLADSINFLNAVENQTVVSLDDITTAIPKVAPVIQQLGGDVKDLTFFIAAMKEGGINASEGANALKSGLAALINPTAKASAMLEKFGINAKEIVVKNKGDLKATVIEFATALNQLDPLNRAQAIEQMFGKFQFARLSTLFANVARDGNQAARVLDLANSSVEELSALSEQELAMTADSAMNKFKKSVEDLKLALVPVGKAFLEAATPIVEFVGGVLEKFGNLSDGTKRLITVLTVGIGAVGPIFLMTFGLLANLLANGLKGVMILRQGYLRLGGQSQVLGEQTQYLNTEQLEAAAVAHSLDQTHAKLTQTFNLETDALIKLTSAYQSADRAAKSFAFNNPGMMMPGKAVQKFAQGGIISGPGGPTSDSVPVMASDGEAIISAKTVKKYPGIIDGLISGNIPGFKRTGVVGDQAQIRLQDSYELGHFAPPIQMKGRELQEFAQTQSQSVKDTINKLINSVQNGLEHAFDVFTNEVVVQSRELNQALGEVGSGNTAPKSLFKEEAVAGAGAYNAPLLAKMKEAGASPEELKIAVAQLAKEFDEGIKNLGDQTTVTAEEVNRITQEAYDTVSKTNKQIKAASEEMKKPGVLKEQFGAVKTGGRTKFSGAYSTSTNRKKVNEIVQQNLPGRFPTQQAANFTLAAAQDVGIKGAQEIREIFRKLDNEAKKRVELLVGDVRAMSKQVIAEAEKAGIDIGKYTIKGISTGVKVASPSKETIRIGEDVARGLEVGMANRQDDVALAGANLGKAATGGVKGGVGPIPFRAPGQPGFVAANIPTTGVSLSEITAKARVNRENLINLQQQRQSQLLAASSEKLSKLNNKIMGSTFALTSFAGIASMAGGNLGKLSEIIFKISGIAFAFSSILNIIPKRLLSFLGKNKIGFGILGLAIAGVTAIIKISNKVREDERKKLEAFGDAVKNSTDQVKSLGEYFNVIPSKTPLESTKITPLRISAERQALDKFKESDTFKDLATTVEALSKLSDKDAESALKIKGFELLGKGFSKEDVQLMTDALIEESGKYKVKVNFKDFEIGDKSINALTADIGSKLMNISAMATTGITKITQRVVTGTNRNNLKTEMKEITVISKELQAELNSNGQTIKSYLNGLSGLLASGQITAEQFNQSYKGFIDTIKRTTPDAAMQTRILNAALNQMESPLAKAAVGVDNLQFKTLLLQAAMVGVIGVTDSMIAKLKQPILGGGGENARQRREQVSVLDFITRQLQINTKAVEAANKAANYTPVDTDKKKVKTQLDVLKQAQDFIALQEQLIDMQNASKLKAYNDEIERQEGLLKNINKTIDEEIEKFVTPIEAKIKANSYLIDEIAIKEDKINEQYNLQIQALNKVKNINEEIAASEKDRLTLADALTRGDISAAAVIAQEARARQAAFINERMETSLTTSRDSRIALLGRNTLEKENKQLQLDIAKIQKEKLDGLNREKDAIQKNINTQNELKSSLEKTIEKTKENITYLGLTKTQIDESVKALDLAQNENINLKSESFLRNVLKGALGDAEALLAALREVAKASKDAFSTSTARSVVASSLGISEQVSPKLLESIVSGAKPSDVGSQVVKNLINQGFSAAGAASSGRYTAQAVAYYQNQINQAMAKATGGMVPKYYVSGGYSKGTDTIPAMLTPGEFVVRKNAVDSFGVNNLNKINDGSYGGSSVYNYSLNVNVKSDSSPDDIARTVMTQIKRIDNQRIKTQRGA